VPIKKLVEAVNWLIMQLLFIASCDVCQSFEPITTPLHGEVAYKDNDPTAWGGGLREADRPERQSIDVLMVRVPKMRHRGFFFFLGPLAFCSGPIM